MTEGACRYCCMFAYISPTQAEIFLDSQDWAKVGPRSFFFICSMKGLYVLIQIFACDYSVHKERKIN